MQSFFIISPLNLEKEVKEELILKWQLYIDEKLPKIVAVKGGIEVECSFEDGLKLNQILRGANKVLLRIKTQKCRDLPKLFKIISKIDWKKYLVQESANFIITAKESRIIHTKRIENTCKDGLTKYFMANKIRQNKLDQFKEQDKANIYLRLYKDELTISLDTTGELLYKRDQLQYKGYAPLRNSLASIINKFFMDNIDADISRLKLIDPMCGSGTLLHEAKNYYKINNREFYFEVISPAIDLKSVDKSPYGSYCGHDISAEVISKLKLSGIEFSKEDVFSNNIFDDECVCILNPPYGKKIKIKEDPSIYFNKLIKNIQQKYSPKAIGIIVPEGIKIKYKIKKTLKVFNSGIWVQFIILELGH